MANHKLLLADDSVTIQKVVNLTFADEGIEVIAVGDGDSAMQKFVQSVPDLVMVDVNMPGIDGYRICEMIKQDEETNHIPVILLVGSFEPFDEEEARRVGADDYLTKPFQSIRQLVNKVSDLLNGKTNGTFGGEPAVVNSFNDTLEMIPRAEKTATRDDFGDSAMDDDLIQTNQIGSLPVNEAQKFESVAPEFQTPDDDFKAETEVAEEESNEDSLKENLPEKVLDDEEKLEDAADSTNENDGFLPRHENIYEFANEHESADEENLAGATEIDDTETEREESTEEFAAIEEEEPEIAPENEAGENSVEEIKPPQSFENKPTTFETAQGFELDDLDLLELPQPKNLETEQPKIFPEQSDISGDRTSSGNLSPEDIEAVADKVVEKISDEVIKRIVREVFTQMTKKK